MLNQKPIRYQTHPSIVLYLVKNIQSSGYCIGFIGSILCFPQN